MKANGKRETDGSLGAFFCSREEVQKNKNDPRPATANPLPATRT